MQPFFIDSSRLQLRSFSIDFLESLLKGPADLKSHFDLHLPDPFTEFPESISASIKHIQDSESNFPFLSYAIILKEENTFIGQCGFVNPPDISGAVEFGYEIAKDYRGRGFADESIKSLIQAAFINHDSNTIMAHTLAEKNASNHLLIKNGFVFEKSIADTKDGDIWKWFLTRKMHQFRQLM
ncbi:MAG: GNAT family N-acetyltransferase [Saprospiraceae bacterium]